MITTPVVVDVRPGAIADLDTLLADQRISTQGSVAVVAGARSGPVLTAGLRPKLPGADWFSVADGTVDAAVRLATEAKGGSYDAIVGIGGGKVLDVTKYAAARLGLPMVAVATNLAHDGIGSPVSTLDNDAGRGSYGVPAPIAVVVDLDLIRRAPDRSVRAGIGEVLSNLSAIADWELAHRVNGEEIDGLAVTFARTAAESVLHHPGTVRDDDFLRTLAEALVLGGLAMVVAGTSRPSSGACHEISHAIDLELPGRRCYHGEQVGVGAAFASFLREQEAGSSTGDSAGAAGHGGDGGMFDAISTALHRHRLPVGPADLGLDSTEFARILRRAPDTRPGRYTILEHSGIGTGTDDGNRIVALVRNYATAIGR